MKIPVEQFLRQHLGIDIRVISNKQWARYCCPIHGETRPSCGTLLVYPYVTKCFSCGYKASLPRFAAHLLKISPEKAHSIIQNSVEISLNLERTFDREREVHFVPTVVVEMYEQSLAKSLAQKYLKYRKVPLWAAKMLGVGYDDLNKAMTVPMINVDNNKVQGYSMVQFNGAFDETRKIKECQDANKTVSTVIHAHGNGNSCIVVEGAVDAMRILQLYSAAAQKGGGLGQAVPVVLNTAFPSREQITYIRRFEKIIIGLDHDDAGEKGKDWIIRKTQDRSQVFELIYPDERKDPGELELDDVVTTQLVLSRGKKYG